MRVAPTVPCFTASGASLLHAVRALHPVSLLPTVSLLHAYRHPRETAMHMIRRADSQAASLLHRVAQLASPPLAGEIGAQHRVGGRAIARRTLRALLQQCLSHLS